MPADHGEGAQPPTVWSCAATPAGAITDPAGLDSVELGWLYAPVPGTAAAALAAAAVDAAGRDLDAEDWWWRTRLPRLPGHADRGWRLEFEGVATVTDVWLDGRHVAHSENMFVPFDVVSTAAELSAAEMVIRCSALSSGAVRRPRPRWKTRLVADQSLRWRRTALIGRIPGWAPGPAPVGPWRPVRLTPLSSVRLLERRLLTRCGPGSTGVVRLQARLHITGDVPSTAVVAVGAHVLSIPLTVKESDVIADADVVVPDVERWWPHTHGGQPLYDVTLAVGDTTLNLGRVGFRDLTVDTSDGGFSLQINGFPVFSRGVCWLPLDPVTLASDPAETRRTLEAARAAGFNLVRVTGVGVYPDRAFRDACDELGLLVWQDLMLADLDPPDNEEFAAQLMAETAVVARDWQPHPSLAVVCGSSEVEQQATYFGLPAAKRTLPVLSGGVPALLADELPDVPYLPSTPTGGPLPTRLREGVTHYFGVGAYLRSLADVRGAGVRFAAECLAFAIPPESADPAAVGTDVWEHGTPRDSLADYGDSWDFEDVTAHYVERIYRADPAQLRSNDPQRYLDLSRAAVCEAMTAVFADWRRPASRCAGGIVLTLRDLVFGPGWGLLDATGAPKAPWWALRPVLAPLAVFTTDEGLDGIALHVVNDTAAVLAARLVVEVLTVEGHVTDEAALEISVAARGAVTFDVEGELIDGFRDLNGAHRFGPVPEGCLVARLEGPVSGGALLAEWVTPLAGPGRPAHDVGLTAEAQRDEDGAWQVVVSTERFAERVVLDLPGWRPARNWFHLPPGRPAIVPLQAQPGTTGRPRGEIRAANANTSAAVR